jgi:Zn-dependent peptidase ImmA (M78 family)
MEKVLQKIIDTYSTNEFIDIEKIVQSFWVNIDYINFSKINGIIIKNRIWINENISIKEQRFTLAHELCHFLLKETGVSEWLFSCKDIKEKRADTFAANFLIPEKQLIEAYNEHRNIPTLSDIFCVPVKAIEKQLIKLINQRKIIITF